MHHTIFQLLLLLFVVTAAGTVAMPPREIEQDVIIQEITQ